MKPKGDTDPPNDRNRDQEHTEKENEWKQLTKNIIKFDHRRRLHNIIFRSSFCRCCWLLAAAVVVVYCHYYYCYYL